MTITPSRLTAASGLCAAAAGALFIGVQIRHPHLDATSIRTSEMAVRDGVKVAMAALALAGVSGLYLSQVRRHGILGLVGYLLLSVAYLLILSSAYVAAFVLPTVAAIAPGYAGDVLASATGGSPTGDIGTLATMTQLQGVAYLAGGLLFGIALFRARVLPRWASALLAAGGGLSAVLSMMPDAFYRLLAVPTGVALIGLGISLWRSQVTGSEQDVANSPVDAAPVR